MAPYAVVVRLHVRQYSTPTDLPVPNKTKVWDSVDEAVKDVKSGDVLLSGGEPLSNPTPRKGIDVLLV